jgi:hypothetical protein
MHDPPGRRRKFKVQRSKFKVQSLIQMENCGARQAFSIGFTVCREGSIAGW